MRVITLLLVATALASGTISCTGNTSPEAMLDEANKALFAKKDYDRALDLYEVLLSASGEQHLPAGREFEAYLNLIRCRILKRDFDGAMASLKKLRAKHESSLTVKHLATIIGDLVRRKAVDQAIQVMELISELFSEELTPEQEEVLKKYIDKILKDGVTDEQIKRLKSLPYL